jgi:2-keto-3-deoxy-L-rhamnonate aldolase RhmA
MPEKSMKEKLAAAELVLCMNLRLARSVDIAMVAKAGGYDALYVDMQHAPYSIETTATICAAALGIGITPLVRVPNHDAQWMSRVLDGGAHTDLRKFLDTSVSSISGHIAGASYRAGEAGAQATAQSERTKPVLVANRFHAISQASMMSARLRNTELASQWLRR